MLRKQWDVFRKRLAQNHTMVNLIWFVICVAAAYTIVQALNETSGLDARPSYIMILCLGWMVLCTVLFHKVIVGGSLLLAGLSGFALYVMHRYHEETLFLLQEEVYHGVRDFIYWASSFYMLAYPRNAVYEGYLAVMLTGLTCMMIYFFGFRRKLFFPVFLFGFVTFCTQWAVGFYASNVTFYFFIGLMTFGYIWNIYSKNIEKFEYSNIHSSRIYSARKFLKCLMPLCIICLLIAFLLPISQMPIQWPWLYERVNQASSYFYETFYFQRVDQFGLNTTGFSSGESFLSGPVRLNQTKVLSVKTDNPRLYLKGSIKDLYTGNSWRSNEPER